MATKKGKAAWVALNANVGKRWNRRYVLFRNKPKMDIKDGFFYATGTEMFAIERFCRKDFELITGYKLSPGECRRVRIKIEEVK